MRNPLSFCCAPVLRGRLARSDAEEMAEAFKAIADAARLRLLNFLAGRPPGGTCVCHLTEPLGLSQPTVSHHLKVLHDAGLLAREKRGTWVYYSIVPERMAALRDALALPVPATSAGPAKRAPSSKETQQTPRQRRE